MSNTMNRMANIINASVDTYGKIRDLNSFDLNPARIYLSNKANEDAITQANEKAQIELALNEMDTQDKAALGEAASRYDLRKERNEDITGSIAALGTAVLRRMEDAEFDERLADLERELGKSSISTSLPKVVYQDSYGPLINKVKAERDRILRGEDPSAMEIELSNPNNQSNERTNNSASNSTGNDAILASFNPNNNRQRVPLLIGSTGRSTGPHVHLELYTPGGKPVDPTPYLEDGLVFGEDGQPFLTSTNQTDGFGLRTHPVTGEPNTMHRGVDIGGEYNQPIYIEGEVADAYETPNGGKTVVIKKLPGFPEGWTLKALHLNDLPIVPGAI